MSLLGYLGAGLGAAFGGWNIAEGFIGRKWQEKQIAEDRQFQQDMYQRQLDDSIDWRTHTEQYNSPEAQMKRYADAGINPMYAITGTGGNAVAQPFSTSAGTHSSNPQPVSAKSNMDAMSLANIRNQTLLAESQAKLNEEQASYWNNRATNEWLLQDGNQWWSDFYKQLGIEKSVDTRTGDFLNNAQMQAKYQHEYDYWYGSTYQRKSFEDAVAQLEHSKVMRQFANDLSEHQRSQFEYELANAKNASEILQVQANWARANQWLNAGVNALGAVMGVVDSFKGTKALPYVSQSNGITQTYHHNLQTRHNGRSYSNYNRSNYY